jgi:hypothetical protein
MVASPQALRRAIETTTADAARNGAGRGCKRDCSEILEQPVAEVGACGRLLY